MPSRETGASVPGRLHVLHVAQPTTEGVAGVALTYVRDQLERGWDVSVACPSDGWLGYETRELGAGVSWWDATREPGTDVLGESLRLGRIIARRRPDVVHLHSAKAGLVGRLVLRGRTPTIFQPHAWSFLAATGATRRAALAWERYAMRWTSELLCVSESERELGVEHGITGPTTVAANGVDLSILRPVSDQGRKAARFRLGLTDAPTVVCVGRLARQKGQEDLLAAWPKVRARIPDAQLMLVGEGPDRELLERQVEPGSGVRLVGNRTDVPLWLAAADVVAVPSRWEGMALAPLEAMASARSVVVTDVTGIAESVPPLAGAMVPPGSPDDLAMELATRLEDPQLAEDEGWSGRAHVEEHHDAARSAADLARMCLRLTAQRQRRSLV
ncbi:glycosyltransferase [Nocardioides sp. KIGAM211]|uniref:Glycosyltransferase n=1 Tax=Nocardioides luti TaxID=2761101 RepID=A0A7X0RJ70_9ACTN|nr:glycosyltransferase [Nocardioides luti]MBB6629319.1 glycosyltransferase [Nocardioides luti]